MISIIRPGVEGSELLARRLVAVRGRRLDRAQLEGLGLETVREFHEPGCEVFPPDPQRAQVQLLVSGIVGEVRRLADGRRQILSLRLPGELLVPSGSETFVALTPVRLADGLALMMRLAEASEAHQPLRRAWISASRVDDALLRDQVVRLGRMSAYERVSHLLLEAHERLAQIGLATETTFHFPLTQEALSDAAGLSVVHLSRTVQTLRRRGLITSGRGFVRLLDRPALVEAAGFVSRFPMPWRPCDARRDPAAPERQALSRQGGDRRPRLVDVGTGGADRAG
jgi:CRP-like cAMP-binding protein